MFEDVIFILAVIGFVVVIYIVVKEFSSIRAHYSKPNTYTGYKPSVKAAGQNRQSNFQVTFKGNGNFSSEPLYLECALYRIVYQFPQQEKMSVDLITADGKQRKSLVINKAGYSSSTFNVQMSKYYVLHVRANRDDANWVIVLNGV